MSDKILQQTAAGAAGASGTAPPCEVVVVERRVPGAAYGGGAERRAEYGSGAERIAEHSGVRRAEFGSMDRTTPAVGLPYQPYPHHRAVDRNFNRFSRSAFHSARDGIRQHTDWCQSSVSHSSPGSSTSLPVMIPSSPPITPGPELQIIIENTPNHAAKRKVQLNDELRLSLVKLCLANQSEHVYGGKTNFWKRMSHLLEQKTGVNLRDPRSTVHDLVAVRRRDMARGGKESETVQGLSQAVDQWMKHIDIEQRKIEDTQKRLRQLAQEKKASDIRRRNLVSTLSMKRRARPDDGESEVEIMNGDEFSAGMRAQRLKRRKQCTAAAPGASSTGLDPNVQAILGGMAALGDKMIQAIGITQQIQQRDSQIEQLRAGQAEMMTMLRELRNERNERNEGNL
ncbi:hypothetical protein BZA05DRAFT_423005 [Tricharina praecox]|uniref:uncharacterized protein n=1 Tax=Tricharina praecox TaxID=43433 RepID=UPI00221EB48F|nr:uncharacterized protein BZA05DRAFT_423005 [Tricharina praecox]KAI5840907.1 hypothetical protein BZA05DRAFT_423005 [Tricharina praecox]